ncbi:MAG: LamG domain-containing protein, partial [Verrucomicrobiales bacterium]|nr:LamG domain-containing protein [Verrucomicrobiales bacterium]
AFWVKKHSETADWVRYVGKGANHPRNFGVWDWEGASGRVVFQFRNTAGALVSCSSTRHVLPGRWYHVTCVWDGATGTVYLDGERDGSAPMTGPVMVSNDPMTLGNAGYSGTLAGILDEVCLFDRALAPAEVLALMNGTSPGPAGLAEIARWKLDEASGFTAADAAGSRHPGSLNVGPQWIAGRFGNGISMNGVDDVVTVDDSASLRLSGPFGMAFWVRRRGDSADWARVVGKGQNYPRNFGVWDWQGGGGRMLFQFRNSAGVLVGAWTTTSLVQGTWYHLACTWDGAVGRVYVNGVLEAAVPMAGPPLTSTDPLTLGHAGYNGYFKGDLDEVGLYGRALTATEVSALYLGTQPASDVRGFWPLGASSGSTATNGVAGGNPGRLNTGPQWAGGVAGNALRFDGLLDMMTVPDAADLRFTGPFTLALWIHKHAESSDWVRILGKGQNSPRNFGIWDWEGASGRLLFQFRNGAGTLASVSTLRELGLGRWYHVACSWDGTTGRIYVDGQLEAVGPMP